MRRDQVLVTKFLDEYNRASGSSFKVRDWREQIERNKPAVEAIAVDDNGDTLALEHTLLQAFVGEKEDSHRFLKAIGSIEDDPALRLSGYMIDVTMDVGVIPNGVDWSAVGTSIREWLKGDIASFPVGMSSAHVPNLPFELKVTIHKTDLPEDEGKIFFGRKEPPDSLAEVVKTAFSKKLPKLVETEATKRIVLFEKDGLLHGYNAIYDAIADVGRQFSELKKIDEIWLLGTVAWKVENSINFARVWPDLAFSRKGVLRIVREAN